MNIIVCIVLYAESYTNTESSAESAAHATNPSHAGINLIHKEVPSLISTYWNVDELTDLNAFTNYTNC